jgi:hypothetical protein
MIHRKRLGSCRGPRETNSVYSDGPNKTVGRGDDVSRRNKRAGTHMIAMTIREIDHCTMTPPARAPHGTQAVTTRRAIVGTALNGSGATLDL